tara:strand:- start:1055 stop:1327 length:273 start_codon:yes stop_codon:yes gene_type:complete
MPLDKFIPLTSAIGEYTEDFIIDYEREGLYICVETKYADEIFKIINSNLSGSIDIVFVKEFEKDFTTIVAAFSEMVFFEFNGDELGGGNN